MAGIAAGTALIAVSGVLTAASAMAAAPPAYAMVSAAAPTAAGPAAGTYTAARMSVDIVLRPQHQAQLNAALAAVAARPEAGRWLAKGQFAARYAPSAATRSAVTAYLRGSGLAVAGTNSPFLLRATGSSAQVSAAFRTTLRSYSSKGTRYFANATAAALPATLAASVSGVVGLASTVREHTMIKPAARPAANSKNCELTPPSRAQLIKIAQGTAAPPPTGFGASPGCNGLTPSQDNSLYGAPAASPRTKGRGVTLGLFELSAYQESDVRTFTSTFFGAGFSPPLVNVNVDGGPVTPQCPAGDTCQPASQAFSGDIEVDADIETQLAIAPDVRHVIVYNAPNDETGQTSLDEYAQIANDDAADSVSSSWGLCENDLGAGMAQAENLIFEQMALQGQSMFASSGDDGAFDCIGDGTGNIVNVDDPEAQPWVTSVGGTSWVRFNPGENTDPAYPANTESVWNPGNLCNNRNSEAGEDGFFYCDALGAGGGGSSQFWGRPAYQSGPGVNSAFTTFGNGSTHCSLAAAGTPCREVPDISAGADEFTPYAEFCTGSAATPGSTCATFSDSQTPPGWFGIGGTSLSSPLWSAIIADRDGFRGARTGPASPLLYSLLRTAPSRYFHDITSAGRSDTNNGLFPAVPGYDEATGIGTPVMAALITQ